MSAASLPHLDLEHFECPGDVQAATQEAMRYCEGDGVEQLHEVVDGALGQVVVVMEGERAT